MKPKQQPKTWMTDITHFLDKNGQPPKDAPKELLRQLKYFGKIIEEASQFPPNRAFVSFVVCRRRPGNIPCHTDLVIHHMIDGVIYWECPNCGEKGYIANWQGSIFDRSGDRKPESIDIKPGSTNQVKVLITLEEYELLLDELILSPEDPIMKGAVSTPDGMILSGSPEALDYFLGPLAFSINHARSVKTQRKLDKIYTRIERVLR